MPNVHAIKMNFTAGELTPRLYGRVDFAKYANGCKTLENCIVYPQGGVTRRNGTRFVAEIKNSANAVRLVPFVFSTSQTYVLEVGPLYIRFYAPDANGIGGRLEDPPGTPYEVATPYTAGDLSGMYFLQSADTVFIAHKSHPLRKLVRAGQTNWFLEDVVYRVPPLMEDQFKGAGDLTLSATGPVGTDITVTSTSADFLSGDVKRMLAIGSGRATVKTWVSTTQVTCTVTAVFASTSAVTGTWALRKSPSSALSMTIQPYPVGKAITLTASLNTFRAADVGKYVITNGGLFEITSVTSAVAVVTAVVSEGQDMNYGQDSAWQLLVPAFTAANGYPGVVSLYQQRLVLAGSAAFPSTIWMSQVGDFFHFGMGTYDSDAIVFTIVAPSMHQVQWLDQGNTLVIGTNEAEFVSGTTGTGVYAARTTAGLAVRAQSFYGSAPLQPIHVGSTLLYLQRTRTRLREFAYDFGSDTYRSIDLAVLAEHVSAPGIAAMAYQEEPNGIIWMVRSDGALVGMTYLRMEQVIAWHRHPMTNGFAEDVTVIPAKGGALDQVWLLVRRTINGVTKRYVEHMDETWDAYSGVVLGLLQDCALTYNGAPATVFTGLSHLEGQTVSVVGDGAVYADAVVVGGSITISPAASKVSVGLPYTSTVVTLSPEVQAGAGTMQGLQKRWTKLVARLRNTLGLKLGADQIPFRKPEDPMGAEPPLFSGDKTLTMIGWDAEGALTITQPQPLPFTLLALLGTLEVGA